MGHLVAKDVYQQLGKKIDGLTVRTPQTETFFNLLKELYSEDEADMIVKMPYTLSSVSRIAKVTGYEPATVQNIMDRLCEKGLVIDLWGQEEYHYMPSPMVIGIFEFTMMRANKDENHKKMALLFNDYMSGEDAFFAANYAGDDKIGLFRTVPHEDMLSASSHIEILDYEKASALVDEFDSFSMGFCSCRHKKMHLGEKECDAPLENCSSFGMAADYLVKNKLAKRVSKTQMRENIQRSKELGLVLNLDNVIRKPTFLCHCCACCCGPLISIRTTGCNSIIVTSGYLPVVNDDTCVGCGKCAKACPIKAFEMVPIEKPTTKKKKKPKLDESVCLGCGVCALQCKTEALKLSNRKPKVIRPETTFERTILQSLEKGTLQNQIFDNPSSVTQGFLRGLVGGFLKLNPVKRALMSDTLRSTFLKSMETGVKLQGKGWLTKV